MNTLECIDHGMVSLVLPPFVPALPVPEQGLYNFDPLDTDAATCQCFCCHPRITDCFLAYHLIAKHVIVGIDIDRTPDDFPIRRKKDVGSFVGRVGLLLR